MIRPAPLPRILADLGPGDGPLLVVLAGVHGNEPAGLHAVRRVIARLEQGGITLKGRLLVLSGNRRALAAGKRYLDVDLNRLWTPNEVARLRRGTARPQAPVDEAEARGLLEVFDGIGAHGSRTVLDLHTTSGVSRPFAVLADSLPNRRLARSLGISVVLGLEEQLDGTLLSFLEVAGWVASGCEGGQHDDPVAIDHCEAAAWLAMHEAGLLPSAAAATEIATARNRLRATRRGVSRVHEVRYRHPVTAEDRFVMRPGWSSFQPVTRGQVLGDDRHGEVRSPIGGRLLMPLYQAKGADGFFVMRPVNRFWLVVSWLLRRLGASRVAHLLPGVHRDPSRPGMLVVDQGTARWFALDVMHLLGFRRERVEGDLLVVSRRADWETGE